MWSVGAAGGSISGTPSGASIWVSRLSSVQVLRGVVSGHIGRRSSELSLLYLRLEGWRVWDLIVCCETVVCTHIGRCSLTWQFSEWCDKQLRY